jgi:cytidine deaminase
MANKEIVIPYEEFENSDALNVEDQNLLAIARDFTKNAYAPYSKFFVAATALLNDGTIVSGTNQENISYPVGICAERSLLSTIANAHPNTTIVTMAISYYNHFVNENTTPATPCGMCRQALQEWELRQKTPFKLILGGQLGAVLVLQNATLLLPFSFKASLKK